MNQGEFKKYTYNSADEAARVYKSLEPETKFNMAKVYQEAFGGYPWFEIWACVKCGDFAKENSTCPKCGSTVFKAAYSTEELIEQDFPEMLISYVPGLLVLAKDESLGLLGFTTGGETKLGNLLDKKYHGNPVIKRSILDRTEISENATVFYENETCIKPQAQQGGLGSRLNLERVTFAAQRNEKFVCGRTVNRPWLGVKESQLSRFGYETKSFVPNGDDYIVDGLTRLFFIATKL